MTDIVRIQDTDIEIVEYKGERVVTHSMIDEVHGHKRGTSRVAFHRNKPRFEKGKHYRVTNRNTGGETDITGSNSLTLLTQRGYMRLCKIFDDDRAWDVFEEMEQTYFGERAQTNTPSIAIPTELTQALTVIAQGVARHEEDIQQLKEDVSELKKDVRVNRELIKINLDRWVGDPERRFVNERQHQSFRSILQNMTGGPTYDTTPDGRTIELYTLSAIEKAYELATERGYQR